MAFLQFIRYSLLLLYISFPLTHSLICTSQNLRNLYKNCIDLPTLSSYLHWTYHFSNSSLSIAFLSSATPNGWISWAINPSHPGMIGAQSLIAFRRFDGSMSVKTYNISSYETILDSNILFNVSDLSAEYSDGMMNILATLSLTENMKVVNQVWQVGGSVVNGETPGKHDLQDANVNARGKLHLLDHPRINPTNGTMAKHSGNSGIAGSKFTTTRDTLFVMMYSIFIQILDY